MADRTPNDVAVDLTAIEQLADFLGAEAVSLSNDWLMPGGRATVVLGPVANLEAWAYRLEATERWNNDHSATPGLLVDLSHILDEDDSWEPPLQTLRFWSEDWRRVNGADYDRAYTIGSEAHFLRWCIEWAYASEPRWDDFAEDVHRARLRMESLLQASERDEYGVPCFACNTNLVRANRDVVIPHECRGRDGVCGWPHRYCSHDRGGLADEWACPKCRRLYDVESYRRAVAHAHFIHAEFLPLRDCVERTAVPRGSIQGWAARGQVAKRRDPNTGRMTYRVADIEARRDRDVVAAS